MIYLTGDTHGQFKRIEEFCQKNNTSVNDVLIILGDVGVNYNNKYDIYNKAKLSKLPITLFCIHGNHEYRASNICSYVQKDFFEGKVLYEPDYENILFAIDGEIYNMNNNNVLVIGGAYSVDKYYRLSMGLNWFADEQPSEKIKSYTEKHIDAYKSNINIVLSHTCPLRYQPVEWFISGLDQDKVDNSTEVWLDTIYDKIDQTKLKKWYCGHYHGIKKIDKMQFMFENYKLLGD